MRSSQESKWCYLAVVMTRQCAAHACSKSACRPSPTPAAARSSSTPLTASYSLFGGPQMCQVPSFKDNVDHLAGRCRAEGSTSQRLGLD